MSSQSNPITVVRCDAMTFRCNQGGSGDVECTLGSDDPCRCNDPMNVRLSDGTLLYHDILCITGTPALNDGDFVQLDPNTLTEFLGPDGLPYLDQAIEEWNQANAPPAFGDGGIMYYDEVKFGPAMDGKITVDFWRREGQTTILDIISEEGITNEFHFESTCIDTEECLFGIPTLSQWGLVILGLSLLIGGTIFIRYRSKPGYIKPELI